jgi:hypothetical protein
VLARMLRDQDVGPIDGLKRNRDEVHARSVHGGPSESANRLRSLPPCGGRPAASRSCAGYTDEQRHRKLGYTRDHHQQTRLWRDTQAADECRPLDELVAICREVIREPNRWNARDCGATSRERCCDGGLRGWPTMTGESTTAPIV